MPEKRRKFDQVFREGALQIVRETGKPIARVARDLGINEGTLGNWYATDRGRVSKHIARSGLKSRLTGPGSAERVICTDSRPGGGWP
jgi:transposase